MCYCTYEYENYTKYKMGEHVTRDGYTHFCAIEKVKDKRGTKKNMFSMLQVLLQAILSF